MANLTKEELKHLQKLSNVNIDESWEEKFLSKLDSVIWMLDKLNTIDAHTLVIAGAEDDLTDLKIQKKISDNIKNSELIILDNTKHNLLIGRNIDKILEIINEFMLKID